MMMFSGDFKLSTPQFMPSGEKVSRYTARFEEWHGPPVEDTWNGKATLDFKGEPQWGEFAVLLSLGDGWQGYAVECYQGLYYWKASPFHPPDRRKTLDPPEHFKNFVDKIAILNSQGGKPNYNGCWDLLAWKGNEYRFIEVKRHKRDKFRPTQYQWFESARKAGVPLESFVVVEWVVEPYPHPQLSLDKVPVIKPKYPSSSREAVHKIKQPQKTEIVSGIPHKGKWDETTFFQDLEARTDLETVSFTQELFTWSKQNAVKIDFGKGEKFGTIIPRMRQFDGLPSFFNIESRGYLWIYLKPFYFPKDKKRSMEMEGWLERLPLLKVSPAQAVMQNWITLDIKALDSEEQKSDLIQMMEWLLKHFTTSHI
jgi:hypothetical protein